MNLTRLLEIVIHVKEYTECTDLHSHAYSVCSYSWRLDPGTPGRKVKRIDYHNVTYIYVHVCVLLCVHMAMCMCARANRAQPETPFLLSDEIITFFRPFFRRRHPVVPLVPPRDPRSNEKPKD